MTHQEYTVSGSKTVQSARDIQKRLDGEISRLDVVKITLKSLPSTIKRKETHIRKEQKIADDPSNPLAYSTQIIINVGRKNKVGLKKELQDLKQDREDLSKEMEQLQAKVLKSKADLKRAKQTEQFEDAKRAGKKASNTRPAPVVQQKKPAEAPKQYRWLGTTLTEVDSTGKFIKAVPRAMASGLVGVPGGLLQAPDAAKKPAEQAVKAPSQPKPAGSTGKVGTKRKANDKPDSEPPARGQKSEADRAKVAMPRDKVKAAAAATISKDSKAAGTKRKAVADLEDERPTQKQKRETSRPKTVKPDDKIQGSSAATTSRDATFATTERKAEEGLKDKGPACKQQREASKAVAVKSGENVQASYVPAGSNSGKAGSAKRQAADDLDEERPARYRKVVGGKAKVVKPDESVHGPSASSNSSAGADDEANDGLLDGKDGTNTLPTSNTGVPICPGMTSGSTNSPSEEERSDGGSPSTSSLDSSASDDKTKALRPEKKKTPAVGKDRHRGTNQKGVAQKKKPQNDLNNGSKKERGAVDKKTHRIARPRRAGDFNGLKNHANSCFSSVVIQLLDVALENDDLDALLGEVDEIQNFDVTHKLRTALDGFDPDDRKAAKLKKKKEAVRDAIKAAAKAGKTEDVSAAKHLRNLLDELRQEYHGRADKNVSPYLLQSVLAFGAAEDADRAEDDESARQQMSGTTQQDCFEYYQMLLNTVAGDPHAADGQAMKQLFEIEVQNIDECKECGSKSDPITATGNYHELIVPSKEGGTTLRLGELLAASKKSAKQAVCKACSHDSLTTTTTFTKVPDNLVLRMNRVNFDQQTQCASKAMTLVDLEPTSFSSGGAEYELSAIVRHWGSSIYAGHYTIFRKQDDKWYELDDKTSSHVTEEKVKDHPRNGQCAMLLFKKIKA
ncbi:hypothetical protein LTR37_002177 [Vermiconidia calcicola]|uniref:Uncharacterized protein n=1 Tax=Vermiconidia calcicola TaxID=1690605 RepID=A0ACC3NWN4_9PEZI|nr:hypothetical protein LTR37_002177 [Vermiconidia calcicola]